MTNPTNAVEKPATGCGCHPAIPHADGRWCEEGERLWTALGDAYEAYMRSWPDSDDELRTIRDYKAAWLAYREHVEASNG